MEELTQDNQPTTISYPTLSQTSINLLRSTATWMNFMSIMGFVFCGIMAILSFIVFIIAITSRGGGVGFLLFIVYVIMTVVILFPNIYLYRCAFDIKDAFDTSNNDSLENAFLMQKKYWKYMSVLTIVYLAFAIIVFLFNIG